MIKVTVVVATFNTGPVLQRVADALDNQTLPQSEFEAVFVDDGSTDDTFAKLQSLAKTRENFRVHRIPNSGWPGRPRNVGADMAKGEYVFFMDHDDYMFPEALERMYRFASANELDVLHPKETVDGWASPHWTSWRHQVGHVRDLDQDLLQCISPHKLYRRQFLIDAHVKFPEGRVRLEDFAFNAQAWARARSVGILADYPCYQWVLHGSNNHRASYDQDMYWASFTRSLQPILNELPAGRRRDHLLTRWYRTQILRQVGPRYLSYSAESRARLPPVFAEQLRNFPPGIDELLLPADRCRSVLLRRQDYASLRQLAGLDDGARIVGSSTSARWDGGALSITVTGMLTDKAGRPFPVERVDGRVLRKVPDDLARMLSSDERDLTSALAAGFVEIVVRGRESRVDWIVPSTSRVDVSHVGDGEAITFSVSAAVDPRSAAFGAPLSSEIWDIFFRLEGLGYSPIARVPANAVGNLPALVAGRPAVAYKTQGDNLSLDLEEKLRTVAGSAAPKPRDVTSRRRGRRTEIRVRLPGVHVGGEASRRGLLLVGGDEWPARFVASDSDGASIIAYGRLPRSFSVAKTVFDGRTSPPLFEISHLRRGIRSGHQVRQKPGSSVRTSVRKSLLDLSLREIAGVATRRGRKVFSRVRRTVEG